VVPSGVASSIETLVEDTHSSGQKALIKDPSPLSKSQNDEDSTSQPPTSKRAEKKKKKKGSQAVSDSTPSVSVSISRPQETPSTSGPTTASSVVDEDGWTNVHEKGNKVGTSSFNRAGESAGEKKTLAEKLLPKPTPTIVDDMLEEKPGGIARVIRIKADEKPPSGFSWKDYDNVELEESGTTSVNDEDEDSGWDVVRSKRPRRTETSKEIQSAPPPKPTKRQRQNAARRDAQKSVRADVERERLATLTRHKKQLEQERIAELYSKGGKGKTLSGGMRALIDENGALVWQ